MSLPEEQRRIDVTTEQKAYRGRPPAPRRPPVPRKPKAPRPRPDPGAALVRMRAALARALAPLVSAAMPWLHRPVTWLAVAALAGVCAFMGSRPPTVDGPALPTAGWRASAFPGGGPQAAIDGDPATRWVAQQAQAEWFAVDMRKPRTFHQVVLDSGAYVSDYPRNYAVYVSGDGRRWGGAVASGEGTGPVTIVNLGRQSARYVKVVQIAQDPNTTWSLCEFTVH